MSVSMSRRKFFGVCGASAAAVATVGGGTVRAANSVRVDYKGFDVWADEALIRRAVPIALGRIQSKAVRQNVYDVGARYALSGRVLKNSNMTDNEKNRKNLLWHQLSILSQPNSPNDDKTGRRAFPDIYIRGVFEPKANWLGRAHLDKVVVKWDGTEWVQEGDFDLQINTHFVNSGGRYNNAEEWASTIAHEMLHNLGHQHPEDDGGGEWQIDALNMAVLCGGHYGHADHKHVCSFHRSGGHDW
ncbi:MAG: hypothetical protein K2X82_19920 [Gemmataceae bacterium]|nr:hypothetical protein [Gemmataceae bacterium]